MTTFGLHLTDFSEPRFRSGSLFEEVIATTSELERQQAFTTLWLADHMCNLGPAGPDAPMPEAYALLNAVAARTSRLQLGALATSVLYRQPQLLAKTVATLDALSGGRAILGIGAGHPRTEAEVLAYGYDFPSVARRMELLDDALSIIRPMLAPTAVPGSPANAPRPSRGLRVLVAGSGEQRLLRIAARYADMINLSFPSGDTLERIEHKRDVLAAHCASVGRDPHDISITYKAVLVVGNSSAHAHAEWDSWRRERGITDLDSRAGVFVGSPQEIAEQFEPWLRVGIDHFVVELPRTDPASIELAGGTLADIVAPVGAR